MVSHIFVSIFFLRLFPLYPRQHFLLRSEILQHPDIDDAENLSDNIPSFILCSILQGLDLRFFFILTQWVGGNDEKKLLDEILLQFFRAFFYFYRKT